MAQRYVRLIVRGRLRAVQGRAVVGAFDGGVCDQFGCRCAAVGGNRQGDQAGEAVC